MPGSSESSDKSIPMKLRVLVVEDEPSISDNIIYALSTEGFEPVACGTGREALDSLNGDGADFIVLDLGLPDVSGFDLLRDIRKTSDIPVIVLTARSDEVDRIVGLEMGADDYMVKPFSPRELTARIRTVLRRVRPAGERDTAQPESASPLFEIDGERRVISYRGTPLVLSRYEYRLLRALVGYPGRVFTRDELMDRAWDEPDMSMDRTVDAHIKTIRRKLREVFPDDDPIVTHRGVGYSLREPE
jgi:two-component system catabolic regulation response regulator CreB